MKRVFFRTVYMTNKKLMVPQVGKMNSLSQNVCEGGYKMNSINSIKLVSLYLTEVYRAVFLFRHPRIILFSTDVSLHNNFLYY